MLITCPECKREISDQAESCPHCGNPLKQTPARPPVVAATKGRTPIFVIVAVIALLLSLATPRLLLFFPLMVTFACAVISLFRREKGHIGAVAAIILGIGVLALSGTTNAIQLDNHGDSEDASTPETNVVVLEVKTWECHSEYGYIKTSGQVINISSNPLKNVEAVSQYYAKDGTFVKSADAVLDYNPIMPGQTSPFSTLATGNPAIKKCDLGFKTLFGGSIPAKFDPAPSK